MPYYSSIFVNFLHFSTVFSLLIEHCKMHIYYDHLYSNLIPIFYLRIKINFT